MEAEEQALSNSSPEVIRDKPTVSHCCHGAQEAPGTWRDCQATERERTQGAHDRSGQDHDYSGYFCRKHGHRQVCTKRKLPNTGTMESLVLIHMIVHRWRDVGRSLGKNLFDGQEVDLKVCSDRTARRLLALQDMMLLAKEIAALQDAQLQKNLQFLCDISPLLGSKLTRAKTVCLPLPAVASASAP